MKTYIVTQVFNGFRDFQNIQAESIEEAIEKAQEELCFENQVNEDYQEKWFAEIDEEEEE